MRVLLPHEQTCSNGDSLTHIRISSKPGEVASRWSSSVMQGEARIRSYGEQGVSYERVILAPSSVTYNCSCSFGAAKVCDNKTTKISTNVVENHLVKEVTPVKIERILTDCGTEYVTWHEEAIPAHEGEKTCNRLRIKHTTTKVKHPWTNGYGERPKNPLR
jgi:hypothetical protein